MTLDEKSRAHLLRGIGACQFKMFEHQAKMLMEMESPMFNLVRKMR